MLDAEMSRAFKKESDELDEPIPEPRDPLPPGVKNYVTPEGAAALRQELSRLADVVRPAVISSSEAAVGGPGASLSRKKRLEAIDRRIAFVSERISNMVVVDPSTQSGDRVRFGARVTVADEDGVEKTYQIVGVDESDPAAGKVSFISPMAKALLAAREGDLVKLALPDGVRELEVVAVTYG